MHVLLSAVGFLVLNDEGPIREPCASCAQVASVVSSSFATLRQSPLSVGFSRQESCSGLPCRPPGDLPDPGIKLVSLVSPALAGVFFTTGATWEAPRESWEVIILLGFIA